MIRKFYLLLFSSILIFSCEDKEKMKEMELKIKEMEIAQREKELEVAAEALQKSEATSNTTTIQYEDSRDYGYIRGNNVIIRKSHSTESSNIGNFRNGEKVYILDLYTPSNSDEAITKNKVKLYNSYGQTVYTLPSGKAVKILNELSNDNYRVSFNHPDHGILTTTINENDLEFISHETWYKVERESGKVGWVFSKFLIKSQ